jgi:hypothetical protein
LIMLTVIGGTPACPTFTVTISAILATRWRPPTSVMIFGGNDVQALRRNPR